MAHERERWLDHRVAELLLRGRQVVTAGIHAQAQADRLARVLEEAARPAYAGRSAGGNGAAGAPAVAASAELPGEAAALAAYRQAVGTAGRTVSAGPDADADERVDGIGTVRLGPERRGVRIPRFGRPLPLGLAAAMAGCALSGVAAGAGYLYAPSGGESPPRPANTVSGAVTPESLVSESPSDSSSPATPEDMPGSTGLVAPGATGSDTTTGTSGGPTDEHEGEKGQVSSGNGWKDGDEKWYAKLVQACHDYRNGTIVPGKKKLLEGAAKGPQGVTHFCDRLLSDGPDGDGHYEGADGNGGGGDSGGGDSPQSGGPIDGGPTDGGGTDGGGTDGGDGATGGGSEGPPSGWPGGEYGETIGMNPPTPEEDGANPPPLLPAVPGAASGADPGTGTGSDTDTGAGESAAPTPDPDLPAP